MHRLSQRLAWARAGGLTAHARRVALSRGYDVDYAPGVVLAQVAAIVSDGGWLQGGSDGRSSMGKAAGY